MATVPNKDGVGGVDKHIYTPAELQSAKTTLKLPPGVASGNPGYVPVP
jgi:hypothetical protein